MSNNNTCKKCGCQDQALTTPIVYPTPTPCPDVQPCSEAFDSACVYYTGNNILCGNDVVVNKDDTIAMALKDIVDYFCANIPTPTPTVTGVLKVDIAVSNNPLILDAVVYGGSAPFSYKWTIEQNAFAGHSFVTSDTADNIQVTRTSNAVKTSSGNDLCKSLIRVEVIDVNGSYGSAYFTYVTEVIS